MEKDDLAFKVLGLRWKQYSVSFSCVCEGWGSCYDTENQKGLFGFLIVVGTVI